MKTKKIKKVLIANRGEIAVRIIRGLAKLGVKSVSVYSEVDENSLHVRLADEAYCIGPALSRDSYLNVEKIVDVAKKSGADAIHPGYGFLAENADFAARVQSEGIIFIGPLPQTITDMGDKIQAKKIMVKNNVQVVPGVDGELKSVEEFKKAAKEIGFPLMLKAAAGGGGKGMRIVHSDDELEENFISCQREALSYFNNDAVFCERYIQSPRHIEFQILFDEHGNGVHLFERDCSIQRRHQKLIEEAPSFYLSPDQRRKMGKAAVDAGKAVNYRGAGTVEFICESPDNFYFMEMNTRIQVEHPVTEMITGVDLIAQQVLVADGQKLAFKQEDLEISGWSIECRINAESVDDNFRAQPGYIDELAWPAGAGVRVDSFIHQGLQVPSNYDSMIAKIIVWGETRDDAVMRMKCALKEMKISGMPTTAKFHQYILESPQFLEGNFDTNFIKLNQEDIAKKMSSSVDDPAKTALVMAILQQNHLTQA